MAIAVDSGTSDVALRSNDESRHTDRETQTSRLDADIPRDSSLLQRATAEPAAQPPQRPQVRPMDRAISRWWTARRAAAYIGAGPKEIYKAVRSGRLKAVRLNRRGDIRTLREWVDEWMEQLQRDGAAM